ncbi:uncharacterized protein LOC131650346 [Vicia villosa]|uniref:uncharacterized protein LOC131650346 n=1 Tax=Vicia villosa TaxID=3911 RepID=UPI00273B1C93|nr:uncharacterized protein LOC131650346 [Vicia villosa]
MYLALRGEKQDVPWKNLMRGNLARPRAAFVFWMACHSRLLTKDRLIKFGIVNDGKCVFCGEAETCNHLFYECRVTREIWKNCLDWLHLQHHPSGWTQELEWINLHARGKSNRARMLKLCATETLYHVWIWCNRRVFKQEAGLDASFIHIRDTVKERSKRDRKLWAFCNTL